MPVLIMVFIGWQTNNNVWLYVALGLSVASLLLKAIRTQAEVIQQRQEVVNTASELLKTIQAKMN